MRVCTRECVRVVCVSAPYVCLCVRVQMIVNVNTGFWPVLLLQTNQATNRYPVVVYR